MTSVTPLVMPRHNRGFWCHQPVSPFTSLPPKLSYWWSIHWWGLPALIIAWYYSFVFLIWNSFIKRYFSHIYYFSGKVNVLLFINYLSDELSRIQYNGVSLLFSFLSHHELITFIYLLCFRKVVFLIYLVNLFLFEVYLFER